MHAPSQPALISIRHATKHPSGCAGKPYRELCELESGIQEQLDSGTAADPEYWQVGAGRSRGLGFWPPGTDCCCLQTNCLHSRLLPAGSHHHKEPALVKQPSLPLPIRAATRSACCSPQELG